MQRVNLLTSLSPYRAHAWSQRSHRNKRPGLLLLVLYLSSITTLSTVFSLLLLIHPQFCTPKGVSLRCGELAIAGRKWWLHLKNIQEIRWYVSESRAERGRKSIQVFIELSGTQEACIGPNQSYKFVVEAFGRRYHIKEQLEIMKRFSHLPFQGKVSLESPQHVLWIIEDYGEMVAKDALPRKVYFARQVKLLFCSSAEDLICIFMLLVEVILPAAHFKALAKCHFFDIGSFWGWQGVYRQILFEEKRLSWHDFHEQRVLCVDG